jgi:hypothetical protein
MNVITNSKVASIRREAKNAINVFQKTVDKLVSTNAKIEKADAVRVTEIDKLAGERNELSLLKAQNLKIINKVNDFLGKE